MKKNSASSVTDLRLLLEAEQALLELLSEHEEIFEIVSRILDAEGFTIGSIKLSDVRFSTTLKFNPTTALVCLRAALLALLEYRIGAGPEICSRLSFGSGQKRLVCVSRWCTAGAPAR